MKINIPKITFVYSRIYDETCKGGEFKKPRKNLGNYPTTKETLKYINKIEKLWRKQEKKILKELCKITGLKWKSKNIKCYVVGRIIPFSDPLTMPVYRKYPDYFIDVLIHELIHNLIYTENVKETRKAWNYIFTKYKKETRTTKVHIPLHAIHSHVYFKFFNEKRLKRDMNILKELKDYKRSWGIVKKEGYENIIKEFNNEIK